MGLNNHHTVEELDGQRCAIVEKNATPERANFLATLLSGNGYTVICVPSPPPKAKAAVPKEGEEAVPEPEPATAASFTVGVTDVRFNPINAVYGRLLKTRNGHIVTMHYWQQKDTESHDDIPYYEEV